MNREDARRKVRALRNTAAAGSGATGPERDTARRLADRLEAEHGLAAPDPSPAAFTVDFAGFDFKFSFDPGGVDAAILEALRAVNADAEAAEAKRRRFRDILNGARPA